MTKTETFKCIHCNQELVLPKSVNKVIGRCPYCENLIVIQLDNENTPPVRITGN